MPPSSYLFLRSFRNPICSIKLQGPIIVPSTTPIIQGLLYLSIFSFSFPLYLCLMSGLSLNVKCQEQKYRAMEVIFASIHKKTVSVDSPRHFGGGDSDRRARDGQHFPFVLAVSVLSMEQFSWTWAYPPRCMMTKPIWWLKPWKSRTWNKAAHLEITQPYHTKEKT